MATTNSSAQNGFGEQSSYNEAQAVRKMVNRRAERLVSTVRWGCNISLALRRSSVRKFTWKLETRSRIEDSKQLKERARVS